MTKNNDQTLALQSKKCTFLKFSRILYKNSLFPQHRIRWVAKDCNSTVIYKPNAYFAIFYTIVCGCVEAAFDGRRSSICVLFPLSLKHLLCLYISATASY
jgi:hypothetical protein